MCGVEKERRNTDSGLLLCAPFIFLNALTCTFRHELLNWFVKLQLVEYQQLFTDTLEVRVALIHLASNFKTVLLCLAKVFLHV